MNYRISSFIIISAFLKSVNFPDICRISRTGSYYWTSFVIF